MDPRLGTSVSQTLMKGKHLRTDTEGQGRQYEEGYYMYQSDTIHHDSKKDIPGWASTVNNLHLGDLTKDIDDKCYHR